MPWTICALLAATGPGRADDGGKAGGLIYKESCARCHGANGEGSKTEFPHPLTGDKTAMGSVEKAARQFFAAQKADARIPA